MSWSAAGSETESTSESRHELGLTSYISPTIKLRVSKKANPLVFTLSPYNPGMNDNVPKGRRGEEIAKKYLTKHGYEILGGHWQKRVGEVDIVAKDTNTNELVFVEVKTASASVIEKFGQPEERVTQAKLKKINKTAQLYLWHHNYPAMQAWRIDVIGLIIDESSSKAKISHFKSVSLSK